MTSTAHWLDFVRLFRICQIEGDVTERPEIRDGVVTEGVVEAKEIQKQTVRTCWQKRNQQVKSLSVGIFLLWRKHAKLEPEILQTTRAS